MRVMHERAGLGLWLAGIILAVGLLLGCGNPLQPNNVPADTGAGTLTLTLNGLVAARTILPDTPDLDHFERFDLAFVGVDGTIGSFPITDWDPDVGTVTVPAGVWNLTVNAFVPPAAGTDPVLAATGTANGIVVTDGVNTDAEVTLYPISTVIGNGTFAWEMDFHESIRSAVMEITRVDPVPFTPRTYVLVGPVATGSTTLQTGQYRVVITLYNTDGERAVASEMLHVFQGMTSRFAGERAAFTPAHFPQSLWRLLIGAWDGDRWDFDYHGITARYFGFIGIEGVEYGDDEFAVGIVEALDYLAGAFGAPADIIGLKALVDAALIRIAPAIDISLHYYRGAIQDIIRGIPLNGTPVGNFEWAAAELTVHVGAYRVTIAFAADITANLMGTVSIDGEAWPGETLTANLDLLEGAGEPIFQWERGTGADFAAIDGATDYYYLVQTDDIGHAIRVRVGREGYTDEVLSPPTAPVAAAPIRAVGETLAAQLAWLRTNALDGNEYLVEARADETLIPGTGATGSGLPTGRTGVTITIRGVGQERVVSLGAAGNLFAVPSGVTLALGENLTLMGRGANAVPPTADNNNQVVRVNSGGTLIMNAGSRVTGNTNPTTTAGVLNAGGGVKVLTGGVFILDGGEISGNTVTANTVTQGGAGLGGGVRVQSGGTFHMLDGVISGNEAQAGGGVYVLAGGAFNMSGGVIHGADAPAGLANRARAGGAAGDSESLSVRTASNARYGTHDAGVFTSAGNLATDLFTIRIENGSRVAPPLPAGGTLAFQLTWLRVFGQSGGTYYVEVHASQTILPTTAAASQILPTGRTGMTINIRGIGQERAVHLSANGSHFWVPDGVTLALGENLTLMGRGPNAVPFTAGNNNHLVRVNSGGTLIMNTGSRVTGNTNTTTGVEMSGGGVRVNSGGVFILDGGEISGNTVTGTSTSAGGLGLGGGVRVQSGGTFHMLDGVISGNEAEAGGGVYVLDGGAFNMSGGVIHGVDAPAGLANRVRAAGAAGDSDSLFVRTANQARYGTHDAGVFTPVGNLVTDLFTIRIENGSRVAPPFPADATLAFQLAWLRAFGQSGGTYYVEVHADQTIHPTTADTGPNQMLPTGRTGMAINIRGIGQERVVNFSANGNLFRVPDGVTLALYENVTLMGRGPNAVPATAVNFNHLVRVNDGGTFVLNDGARIVNNFNGTVTAIDIGGGVRVNSGGTFEMLGGTIARNQAGGSGGGGVHVVAGGTFNMGGGVIYGSDAPTELANVSVTAGSAALFVADTGTARYGSFDAQRVFTPTGSLTSSTDTLRVGD